MTTIPRPFSVALISSLALFAFGCFDELEDEDEYADMTVNPDPRNPGEPPGTNPTSTGPQPTAPQPTAPQPTDVAPAPQPTDPGPAPTEPSTPSNPLDELPPECADVPGTIFGVANKCGGVVCHGSPGQPPLLYLDLGNSVSDLTTRLVNLPAKEVACAGNVVIDPANPDASLLITKLTDPPGCGLKMPYSAPELSASELNCIQLWTRAVATMANR